MTREEIKELIANVRMYEIDHAPDGWPAVKTQELTKMADAIEQLQIEAEHWREAYQEERAKYINLINNK